MEYGASIGAGAIIVTGVTIGRFAMVAAGAVVTRDVPPHGLVMGVPAQLVNHVCACGQPLPCNDTNRLSDLANVVAADPPQPRRTAYTHAGYGNQGSVKYLCDVCDTLWENGDVIMGKYSQQRCVRIGVIGVGRMGRNHCRVLSTMRHTLLVGISDLDPVAGAGGSPV
ncbi:MAG: hypothetical protein R2867_21125 [Caldilineaceae bacterium]